MLMAAAGDVERVLGVSGVCVCVCRIAAPSVNRIVAPGAAQHNSLHTHAHTHASEVRRRHGARTLCDGGTTNVAAMLNLFIALLCLCCKTENALTRTAQRRSGKEVECAKMYL